MEATSLYDFAHQQLNILSIKGANLTSVMGWVDNLAKCAALVSKRRLVGSFTPSELHVRSSRSNSF